MRTPTYPHRKNYKGLFIAAVVMIILHFMFSSDLRAQTQSVNSRVNVGVGAGPNYGTFGVKTVMGKNNSGLLLGVGALANMFAYEVGFQYAEEWRYVNIGYGVYGVSENATTKEKALVKGGNLIFGVMIGLSKSKRLFLDLGVGVSWGGRLNTPQQEKINGLRGVIGIGYRLGRKKV